jgi:hypothetical protein
MQYSIEYFKDTRTRIDDTYRRLIADGVENLLLWRDGEVAELCYLSLRGLPLNLVGVVDSRRETGGFYGHNIYSYDDVATLDYDAVLIASFEKDERKKIEELGVDKDKIHSL